MAPWFKLSLIYQPPPEVSRFLQTPPAGITHTMPCSVRPKAACATRPVWRPSLGTRKGIQNNPLERKVLRAFVQRSLLPIPIEAAFQTRRQGDIRDESVSLFPV